VASSSPLILFVVRLLIRVEGYMMYFIRHHKWDKQNINSTGWASFVRGLDCTDEEMVVISEKRDEVRTVLNNTVFPMIDRWCRRAMYSDNTKVSCVLHAHLAYFFLNVPPN
jgi:hypothetical protein